MRILQVLPHMITDLHFSEKNATNIFFSNVWVFGAGIQTDRKQNSQMHDKVFLLPTPDEHRHTISFQNQNIQYRTELTIACQYLNN